MGFLDNTGLARVWEHIQTLVGNKVDKVVGKSLIEDTEIERLANVKTGLEIEINEDETLEEGLFIVNADQLGGINAEDYATKADIVGITGSVSSVNGQTGDVVITAETLGAITNINGLEPNEDGSFDLDVSKVGGLTVDLDGALEGDSPKVNADLLGGKEASEYALKIGVVTSVNGQTGDVIVTEGGGYVDTSGFYSTSNPPPYPVSSVNGKTGAVEITAASLGAITSVPVSSVNGKIGAVQLNAGDVGALPSTYEAPVTSVNGQTGNVNINVPVTSVNGQTGNVTINVPVTSVNGQTGDVTISNAVTSVNGKTGAIKLVASDVGAMPSSYSAPVTSVNGKTGAVSIAEIKYADLDFNFSGESLASYAPLPSGLTNINQIVNILSFTHQVFITKPSIYGGNLYVAAHSTDIGGEGNVLYPYYLDYYATAFTARVFYI